MNEKLMYYLWQQSQLIAIAKPYCKSKISIATKKNVYHARSDMVLYKLDIFVK